MTSPSRDDMKPKRRPTSSRKTPVTPTLAPGEILKVLQGLYPDPESELEFTNEYELIVAVILSAQCTDKKVNEVTPALFEKFPSFAALSSARLPTVERIIRPVNYYRTKAKNIIAMAKAVVSAFGGKVPHEHAALVSLPGVGRKTANVVLGELGITPALPVDTHVFRLAHRLGLSSGKTVRDVENDLMHLYKPSQWRALHHSLILHGRRVCKAQKPACAICPLQSICPGSHAFLNNR